MSRYIPDLDPWPLGTPLPANGLFVFYDPQQDDEFRLTPEQVAGAARAATNDVVGGPKSVIFLTHADAVAAGRPTDLSLDQIPAGKITGGNLATVDLPQAGQSRNYVARYDGSPTPQLRSFIDGRGVPDYNRSPDGLVPLRWYAVNSPAAGVPAYASLPDDYAFELEQLVRAYVSDATSERFFKPRRSGPLPAPGSKEGDSNWEAVNEADVPVSADGYTKAESDEQRKQLDQRISANANDIFLLKSQKVAQAALVPRVGPVAYFGTYAQAEQYALAGDTIYLSGYHGSVAISKSVTLYGGSCSELVVGFRSAPLVANVAGVLCTGRVVTCVPLSANTHTVSYTNLLTGPDTFFEQYGLGAPAGAYAEVLISQTRLHNRGPAAAEVAGQAGAGCLRFQERDGQHSRYTLLDSDLRSEFNAAISGYPTAGTSVVLAGRTTAEPAPGRAVQETRLLNAPAVQPDADILVDQRTPGGGVGAPARDPYAVAAAKRKAVVDAAAAVVAEPDATFYACEFVDEVYGPTRPAYYKCLPSAPAATGGATAWKWFRFAIQ